MSSFDGKDIFGSGPHTIVFEEIQVDSWKKAFPGVHGTLHFTGGWRGRTGTISGRLEAESPEEIDELVDAIEAYMVDGTAAELVDHFDRKFQNIVLEPPLKFNGQMIHLPQDKDADDLWIQSYELKITQLRK
jgi:hypothetical protein